jgi:hypothetical protein
MPSISKNETYVCVRECYTYNKRFKVGDKFPDEWLKNDYYPNHHFMPEAMAQSVLKDHKKGDINRPMLCAGDDPRSTNELMEKLLELGASADPKWGRQQVWMRVNELENARGKTAPQESRGPGRPPAKKE